MSSAVLATSWNFPERLPSAFLMAVAVHFGLVGVMVWAPKPDFKLPEPLSGFEMVELPSPSVLPEAVAQDETVLQEDPVQQPEPIIEPVVRAEEVVETPTAPDVSPPVQKAVEPAPRITPRIIKKPTVPVHPKQKMETRAPVRKLAKKTVMPTTSAPASLPLAYIAPNANLSYLRNPKPFYPRLARKRGLQGIVLLSVSVNAVGVVTNVVVKKSSTHKVLDEAALKGVQAWKFQPAMRGGSAVAAVVDVPIRFELNER